MSSPQPKPPWVQILAICVLWAATFLPNLGAGELDNEEGRRAWPAREMLESGDYVLPTIFGRPYLAKPPAYFWAVASLGKIRGEVDEHATRLPAAWATLATALLLLALLRRRTGNRIAGWAALMWLVAFEVHKKGALGELEAQLALFTTLSIACLWRGRAGGWRWALLGGLALAGATLTKGPPALLFHGAAIASLLWTTPDARRRWGLQAWVPFAIGLAAIAIWGGLVRARPEAQDAMARWQGELVGRGSDSAWVWIEERATLWIGVLTAFLPATLFWIVGARGPTRARVRLDPQHRFVTRLVWISLLALSFTPGVRVRYAYPLGPWIAVLAGITLMVAAEESPLSTRRFRWMLPPFLLLGLILATSPLHLPFGSYPGLPQVGSSGPLAIGVVITCLFLAFRWRKDLTPVRSAGLIVMTLAATWLFVRTEVEPLDTDKRGRRRTAHLVNAWIQEGEILHVSEWTHFNMLFYVDAEMRWVDGVDQVEPGDLVLTSRTTLDAWTSAGLDATIYAEANGLNGLDRVLIRAR